MPVPTDLMATPFADRFASTVADWIEVMGYAVPISVSDPLEEYRAIRERAAVTDYSMLFKWHVDGTGAPALVDSVVTRNVAALRPGRIAYGPVVDENGGMVDDVTVLVISPEHVVVTGGNPRTGELLASRANSSAHVHERRGDTGVISIQGPRSREILQRLTPADVSASALPYYESREDIVLSGAPSRVSRIGFTAELGYEVEVSLDRASGVWDAICEEGQALDLRVWGADALMMCRIEAGFVMLDLEYDGTMTPFECRLGWAVDFEKGPFLGRDALLARRDSAPLRVASVLIDGPPGEGLELEHDGLPVGVVTMAMPSPELGGRTLGLARLPKDLARHGTRLRVTDGAHEAEVIPTPVYDPERLRVRA
jgi:aminomethyltransferase